MLPDGSGIDYALARPSWPGVMQPDGQIDWAPVEAAHSAGALHKDPAYVRPDGTLDRFRLAEVIRADYDRWVTEFFKRWLVQHGDEDDVHNASQKCRRTLGNMAMLQGGTAATAYARTGSGPGCTTWSSSRRWPCKSRPRRLRKPRCESPSSMCKAHLEDHSVGVAV